MENQNQTERQKEENETFEDISKKTEPIIETVQEYSRNSSLLFRYFFYILFSLFLSILFVLLIIKNTLFLRFRNYRNTFVSIKSGDKLIKKMLYIN